MAIGVLMGWVPRCSQENHHGARVIGAPDRAQCFADSEGREPEKSRARRVVQVPCDEAVPSVRREGVGVAWARSAPLA